MIRPATIFVFVFRLVLVIVLVTAVAIMIAPRGLVLVGVVPFFLELAVRILAGFLAVGSGGGMVRMRGHDVLALTHSNRTTFV
mgnify:CR=1 FL=1